MLQAMKPPLDNAVTDFSDEEHRAGLIESQQFHPSIPP
jgi:hypothetical protein